MPSKYLTDVTLASQDAFYIRAHQRLKSSLSKIALLASHRRKSPDWVGG